MDNVGTVATSAPSSTPQPTSQGSSSASQVADDPLSYDSVPAETSDSEAGEAETEQAEGEEPSQEQLILGKFKSPDEVTKAYSELEKLMGTQAQERAAMKQRLDQYDAWMAQQQQAQAPQQQQAPQRYQYFQQLPEPQQEAFAQNFAQRYAENPLQASYDLVTSLPQSIDQHIMNSPVFANAVAQKVLEVQNQIGQRSTSLASGFNQFLEANPKATQYRQEFNDEVFDLINSGMYDRIEASGGNPLQHALRLVLGAKHQDEVQAAIAANDKAARARELQAKSGYQISAASTPKGGKPDLDADPLNLAGYHRENQKRK